MINKLKISFEPSGLQIICYKDYYTFLRKLEIKQHKKIYIYIYLKYFGKIMI